MYLYIYTNIRYESKICSLAFKSLVSLNDHFYILYLRASLCVNFRQTNFDCNQPFCKQNLKNKKMLFENIHQHTPLCFIYTCKYIYKYNYIYIVYIYIYEYMQPVPSTVNHRVTGALTVFKSGDFYHVLSFIGDLHHWCHCLEEHCANFFKRSEELLLVPPIVVYPGPSLHKHWGR